MPTLLEYCDTFFGTKNLYELMKIEKTATEVEIKKAYKKLSLLVHPDRVPDEEKESATEKFKVLGKVHSILSDSERRSIYDETGCVDEEDDVNMKDRDWDAYWRLLFKEITIDDIKEYEKQYKGSKEEIEDLIDAYNKGKGDMDVIFEMVPFTTLDEEPRIREVIKDLIEKGEIPSYEGFEDEDPKKKNRRKRRLEKEAKEVEKVKKEMEKKKKSKKEADAEEELLEEGVMKAILKRKAEREAQADSFFNHLAAKYGNGNKKSGKRKAKK